MIVVEARPVRKHQIAFHVAKREWTMRIEAGVLVFFFVLGQSGDAKSPGVLVRIFSGIIPEPLEGSEEIGTHQFHRLDDRIDLVPVMPRNAVFGFDAK